MIEIRNSKMIKHNESDIKIMTTSPILKMKLMTTHQLLKNKKKSN